MTQNLNCHRVCWMVFAQLFDTGKLLSLVHLRINQEVI